MQAQYDILTYVIPTYSISVYCWLAPGKFLPFKTPLGSRYDQLVPEDRRFNVEMLVAYMEALERRMGMVIDLTKTDRFYDKQELADRHIGHYKLKCEG